MSSECTSGVSSFSLSQTIEFPSSGVLDMKLSEVNNSSKTQLLGIALSSATISFCSVLVEGDGRINLVQLPKLNTFLRDEGLILSLSWSECKLAASTQSSSIVIFDVRNDSSGVEMIHQIKNAHQLLDENVPAWTTAFDKHDCRRLISGGDDMMLKLWDMRVSGSSGPISINKRTHRAGVTAVCSILFYTYSFGYV